MTSNNIQQISSDIYQIAIPVPFRRLGVVNCYLLRDETGWVIVDTGVNIPNAQVSWRSALQRLDISPADISQIILTHIHPDHFGMAGWLQDQARQAGAASLPPVRMSLQSIDIGRSVWAEGHFNYEQTHQFWSLAGLPETAQQRWVKGIEFLRQAMLPYPAPVEAIALHSQLTIGARQFRVWDTPGHSDGHIALYDPADQLMIIGDQVLAHITPNIGLWPGTETDPLGRYLQSLAELAQVDVRLALPGHGPLITNWQTRIEEIRHHHDDRLAEMAAAARHGATAFEVTQRAFDFHSLSPEETEFAVTETLAHLEYLVQAGQLNRYENDVWLYEKATSEEMP